MVNGRYEKPVPSRTIKSYAKPQSKSHGNFQKNAPPTYSMPRWVKRRLFALAAAGLLSTVGMASLVHKNTSKEAYPAQETPAVHAAPFQREEHKASPKAEDVYIIGVTSYDAEITVDGKSYPVGDSFATYSQNGFIVSDVHGNFLEGDLTEGVFTEITRKTESQMENYNYFKVISDSPANVRSSGEIADDNIISTVSSGDYVLGYEANTPEYDGEWILTLSINGSSVYEGYIREDLLQEIDAVEAINYRTEQDMQNIQGKVMVDTSRDQYITLNLRSEPGKDVIARIPHGSFVDVVGPNMQYGNRNWSLVNYSTPGSKDKVQGWVATQYLTNEVVQEQPGHKIINGTHVNATGNVTGIDVSTLSPKALRYILENGISDQSGSVHGTYDTSQYSGKIGYVYMKLGASSYGNGDFSILDYDNYIEQVAICEELGVPYGFYYYSTAITPEEARIELDCIKERIEDLRQRYDMKNNVLEIAVDIELTNSNDRQYNGNIAEQTEAKAVLINGIQEENISDHVLIYGPGRVMQPDLDQIFDLEQLNSLLTNPEAVSIWQCSLMQRNGNMKADVAKHMSYAEKCGFDTSMCQMGLDLHVEQNGKVVGLIDINNMDFEHYQQLVNPQRMTGNVFYSLEDTSQGSLSDSTLNTIDGNVEHDDDIDR